MLDLRNSFGNSQGEIFSICWSLGIPCFLEVQTKGYGRPDCVIVVEGRKIIIECKKRWHGSMFLRKQIKIYLKLKVPIIIVTEQDNFLHVILSIYDSHLENKVYFFNGKKLVRRKTKHY